MNEGKLVQYYKKLKRKVNCWRIVRLKKKIKEENIYYSKSLQNIPRIIRCKNGKTYHRHLIDDMYHYKCIRKIEEKILKICKENMQKTN